MNDKATSVKIRETAIRKVDPIKPMAWQRNRSFGPST